MASASRVSSSDMDSPWYDGARYSGAIVNFGMSTTSFADLGVTGSLVDELEHYGVGEPSMLQVETLPDVFAGSDVIIGGAEFREIFSLIAIASVMGGGGSAGRAARVLVLEPTHERSREMAARLNALMSPLGMSAVSAGSGIANGDGSDGLSAADIVVATPAELVRLTEQETVSIGEVRLLVLDKADEMTGSGPRKHIEDAVESCDSQILLFTDGGEAVEVFVGLLGDPAVHPAHFAPPKAGGPAVIEVQYQGSRPDQPKDSKLGPFVRQVLARDAPLILRRHAGAVLTIALVTVMAVNVVFFIRRADGPQYVAEALVVASEGLEIRVDSFPRTATGLFNGRAVADLTADYAGTGLAPDAIIPDIVSIRDGAGSGVVELVATHSDPELAALYANSAGRALADELNRVGSGAASFAVFVEATVPTRPRHDPVWPTVLGSVLAGLGLAGAVVVLAALADRTPASSSEPPLAGRRSPATANGRNSAGGPGPTVGGAASLPAAATPSTKAGDPARYAFGTSEGLEPIAPLITPLEMIPQPSPVHPLLHMTITDAHPLEEIEGIDTQFAARLDAAGITTLRELADADFKWLADAIEVPRDVASAWVERATSHQTPNDVKFDEAADPVLKGGESVGGASTGEAQTGETPKGPPGVGLAAAGPPPVSPSPPKNFGEVPGQDGAKYGPMRRTSTSRSAASEDSENADRQPGKPSMPNGTLPVRTVSGIGEKYSDQLADCGIQTLGDLARSNPYEISEKLVLKYGRVAGWIAQAQKLTSEADRPG